MIGAADPDIAMPPVPTSTDAGRVVTATERDIYIAAVKWRGVADRRLIKLRQCRDELANHGEELRRCIEDAPVVTVEKTPWWQWPVTAAALLLGVIGGFAIGSM
jgi:hypothetical protein